MIEENLEIIPTNPILYVFEMHKVDAFMLSINSIPPEEIGSYLVWNALQKEELLYSSTSGGEVYKHKEVFCLQTDFKEEHAALRQAAEQQSVFYCPILEHDKKFINEFFGLPSERSPEYQDYLISINKA